MAPTPSFNITAASRKRARAEASQQAELLGSIGSSFKSEKYSDLTIRTRDGQDWRVHKLIVCTRCEFFARAINGNFKEAKTGVIEMPNDPSHAVVALLEFLYNNRYTVPKSRSQVKPLMFHVEAYILGEIYNQEGLKGYACAEFAKSVGTGKMHCPGDIIPCAVKRIYQSIPEDKECAMRSTVITASAIHLPSLLQKAEFAEVMASVPRFAQDVGKALLSPPRGWRNFPCEECRSKAK